MKVKYREISKDLLKMASPSPKKDFLEKNRSSVNTPIDVVEHYRIDVEKLIPFHKQARRNFNEDEIKGLAQSIKEHGVRQPLTIIQSSRDEAKFEVVSGERRLRASILAGLQKIPCIIISNPQLAEEIALVENIQRQDLHPVEMGEAFLKILEGRSDLTQISLSEKLGLSNKSISECIQYAKLPDDVKDILVKKDITQRDVLRKLLKSNNPIEVLLPKNSREVKTQSTVRSVLRISLVENKFHVQAEAINMLGEEKKQELKGIFNDILKLL